MTEYVLLLSYGKDSLACLEAIKILGLPLTRIIHTEIWATETISADLPPMVEFKKKADKIIKDRYGIEVEHICALKTQGWVEVKKHTNQCSTGNYKKEITSEKSKASLSQKVLGAKSSNTKTQVLTYEDIFYRKYKKKDKIYGFPMIRGQWCTGELKQNVMKRLCSQIVQVERERERTKHAKLCNISV